MNLHFIMKCLVIILFLGFVESPRRPSYPLVCFKALDGITSNRIAREIFAFSAKEELYPMPNEMIATIRMEKRRKSNDLLVAERTTQYELVRQTASCDRKFTFKGFSDEYFYSVSFNMF